MTTHTVATREQWLTARAQLLQRLHSINARQPHVKQHTPISASLESLQTLLARRDRIRRESFILQHSAQRVADASFIINNEYRFRHLEIVVGGQWSVVSERTNS